jgi:hypothetical protein
MNHLPIRSPYARVGGLVYFGRMLDKIRAHAKGALPEEYQANLGKGFDASCFGFGRQPTEDEMYVWNEFMRKRGWSDELSETLKRRKKEAGMAGRSEIATMFSFIDADEGRSLVNHH